MKKITLTMFSLFAAITLTAQTYSTGSVTFSTDYSAKIDVNSATVTLQLTGPSTGYLGIAFDASSMEEVGKDVVIFDGTNLTDRTFAGIGSLPPDDAVQNWTIVSNIVSGGSRTVIGTRARDTGDSNDYVFTAAAQPLTLTWAYKPENFTLAYHGNPGRCGFTVAGLTLGTEDFAVDSFKMFPNPAKGFTTIELPGTIVNGEVKVYDQAGKVVRKQVVDKINNTIDTSDLATGAYLLVLRTEYGNATKKLMVE